MRAAYYTTTGAADAVLQIGEQPDPTPGPGEVQLAIHYSGLNHGDVKKRSDAFGTGMRYPLVIPHSDGAGVVTAVGPGVDAGWIGRRALCFGAQSGRARGTAAALCALPEAKVVALPAGVDLAQAAQMGIPGITAYQALHCVGGHADKTVLVQGGLGAVGRCAIALAKRRFRAVYATCRAADDLDALRALGVDGAFVAGDGLVDEVLAAAGKIDHVVEVAFAANHRADLALLVDGGSIATYATDRASFELDFWPLVFRNCTVAFLGSDDFTPATKHAAAEALVATLADGWGGLPIGEVYPLDAIAEAHRHVEEGRPGRALVRVV